VGERRVIGDSINLYLFTYLEDIIYAMFQVSVSEQRWRQIL
jgi:hypothetical protein